MTDKTALNGSEKTPNQNWQTPTAFARLIQSEFGSFALDAAASHENALADWYYTEAGLWTPKPKGPPERLSMADGLTGPWRLRPGPVWCNPPYGRAIAKWVAQGRDCARDGSTAIMLIPPSRNTVWWNELVEGVAAEVRYLLGRIQFDAPPGEEQKDRNRYDSALVIFRPRYEARRAGTLSYGWDWRKELARLLSTNAR